MKPYDFGLLLKELREAKGLSQLALAEKLGLDKSSISGYERNIAMPSFEILKKLVFILDTTADYLLGVKDRHIIVLDDLDGEQSLFAINHFENFKQELIEYEKRKKDNE